jgi:hypothetical protein
MSASLDPRAKQYTPVFVLVGNKADIFETECEVTEEEGRQPAQKFGCKHFEVSALNNNLFTYLVQSMRCSMNEIENVEKTRKRKKRRVKLRSPCLVG